MTKVIVTPAFEGRLMVPEAVTAAYRMPCPAGIEAVAFQEYVPEANGSIESEFEVDETVSPSNVTLQVVPAGTPNITC